MTVDPAPWHRLEVTEPPAEEALTRFEASSVAYADDLYVFGGASRDKTYLNDVWVLSDASSDDFSFVKNVTVEVHGEETLENATVEVRFNIHIIALNIHLWCP